MLLGSAALIGLAGAAGAADLPIKMPVKAAPPVAYDWNGFYVGAYYGTAVSQIKAHTDPPGVPFASENGVADINRFGLTVGGTVGYNWQFSPSWLVGIEGDLGWLGVDNTHQEWDDSILAGSKASWYGTLRARFGYVTGPSLLYLTGGAAFVHVTDTFGGGGLGPATTNSATLTGWTVGGGIETKLSRNWSAKTEYLFIDAGSETFASNPFGFPAVPTTFDHTYHVVKAGLNYRLDGPWEGLPFFTAPLLPSSHNWGGFYAGVNVGGGISLMHAVDVGTSPGGEEDVNGTGFAAGGQVGFNYLITPRWFAGLEGDIGYLGVRGAVTDWFDTPDIFAVKTSWYGTARARIGSSTGPALLYFTAGAAWVGLKDGFLPSTTAFLSLPGDVSSRVATGWTIGGGTEVAIDARWSARLESLYIDVGHREHNDAIGLPIQPFFADFKDRFMVVRAGLNYRFGADDVVRTRY
jgi:outer membrane immunogenic protein